MLKLNCWEFTKCGRETGGANELTLGACPAAQERRLDGAHGGRNGGRACWVVAGSMCGGEIQGTFANKFQACSKCAFYLAVQQEERGNFNLSATLLQKLRTIGDRSALPVGGSDPSSRKVWWRGSNVA